MEKAHPEINELFIDWFQLFPVRVGGYSEKEQINQAILAVSDVFAEGDCE